MNIIIIVDTNPIQRIVSPSEKIYNYMSRLFNKPISEIKVKISPTHQIDKDDDFLTYKLNSLVAFYVTDLNDRNFKYPDTQIKKQTSIQQQFGYCCQDDEINKNSTINSNKSFREEKQEKLEQLQQSIQLSNESSQQIIDYQQDSTPLIKFQKCEQCQKCLDDPIIETPCFHIFHINCFRLIVENQKFRNESILRCICNQKLNFKIMYFLDDKYEAEAFKYSFLLNQLQELEKNIKQNFEKEYRKCKNVKSCYFFYMHQPNLQMEHKYCPQCLGI